ncbi:Zinc finger BED domain-containing protein 6 [Frankliniella fusca]|uniref:Zinc finger BED domain-containing protein 6 n=1 Tax=Frankliniella fusca TaxID=407009 RepID=A0AAE1LR65_9NEOP|nr:Zinc finger BED domain-containing protein 6 [Frankliniella fusca]
MSGFVINRKAPVWRYFKDDNPPKKDMAVCNLGGCKTLVPCRNGGTTGVESHLRVHHALQYAELLRKKRQAQPSKSADILEEEEIIALENEGEGGREEQTADGERPESSMSSVSVRSGSALSVMGSPPPTPESQSRPQSARSGGPGPDPGCRPASEHRVGLGLTMTQLQLRGGRQQKLEAYRPMSAKEKERCDMAVAHYVVSCMRPLNTVDKDGFRKMVKVLNPKYTPPSRRTLTDKYIPRIYNATRENVTLLMKQADYIALTTDGWTSGALTSFISLTAHFLDNDWVLVDVTLSCKQITEDHTGLLLKPEFEEMLNDWNISKNRISAFTTDNVMCMCAAFAHTVNNGVSSFTGTCNILENCLRKARSLRSFMTSEKVWRHYNNPVTSRYNEKPSKLPAPCKSRWWVDLHLATAVVAQHTWLLDFMATFARGKHIAEVPTLEEVSVLKSYIQAMKPIQKISTYLGAQKYCTASFILLAIYLPDPNSPMYGGDDLDSLGAQEGEEANNDEFDDIPLSENPDMIPARIQKAVVQKLKKRFKPDREEEGVTEAEMIRGKACYDIVSRCSYLDPRFRGEILEEDRERAKELLLEEVKQIHSTEVENQGASGTGRDQGAASGSSAGARTGARGAAAAEAVSALSGLFKKRRLATAAENPTHTADDRFAAEVTKYELIPAEDLETCPFQ